MFKDSLKLISIRIIAHKYMLSAVFLGVILSSTITSTTIIYFDSLRDIALQSALKKSSPQKIDLLLEVNTAPTNNNSHQSIIKTVNSTSRKFKEFIVGNYLGIKTWTFFIDNKEKINSICSNFQDSNLQSNNDFSCLRANFILMPDFQNTINLVEGSFPNDFLNLESDNQIVETLIDLSTAEKLGLTVGDHYSLNPHWTDTDDLLTIEISGIYARSIKSKNSWYLFDTAFSNKSPNLIFMNLLVSEQTILNGIVKQFPKIGTEYAWLLDISPEQIRAADSTRVQEEIDRMSMEMETFVEGFILRTDLQEILQNFERELYFSRLPMIIVISLIVLVVLYYTMILSGLLIDSQKSEITLLRIRGATSFQILLVFILEAIFFITISVIIGPFLSLGIVSFSGLIYSDLNQGMPLPVNLNLKVFILALFGGLLSFIPLIIPAYNATRQAVISSKFTKSRPISQNLISKYYLDVGFIIIAVFLFWLLSREGSFLAVDLFGEKNINNLLLAFPAFFLVSIGIILLRIFPLLVGLLAKFFSIRFLSDLIPPILIIALWQMARNPSHYSKLSFLIVLTAGVGVFASTFSETLVKSSQDGVFYNTGSDIRFKSISLRRDAKSFSLSNKFQNLFERDQIMELYRIRGITTETYGTQFVRILGIDYKLFEKIGWIRSDINLGQKSSSKLQLYDHQNGILLPEKSEHIFMSVNPLSVPSESYLVLRMSDKNDRYFSVYINWESRCQDFEKYINANQLNICNNDYIVIGGKLSSFLNKGNINSDNTNGIYTAPLKLHSFGIVSPRRDLLGGYIDIDSIQILTTENELSTIEDFDNFDNWHLMMSTKKSVGDTFINLEEGISRFRWTPGKSREYRGVTFSQGNPKIPVIANNVFKESFGVKDDIPIQILINDRPVNIFVLDTIDYFPSIESHDKSFIIMDKKILHNIINRTISWGEKYPDELWIKSNVKNLGDRDLLLEEIDEIKKILGSSKIKYGNIVNRFEEISEIKLNPLIISGWKALLGISFFTVLVVTSAGFMVHSRISFRSRKTDHALLRTIGLSGKQLLLFVFIEQFFVIFIASAVGIFMGLQLGTNIMPYLANSGTENTLNLPMKVVIDWFIFLSIFGILSLVFLFIIINTLISVYRMSINSVMRMGQ